MTVAEPQRRTRLAPQARRSQILDLAARVALSEGLQAVTMERLARDAGISKALVYNYFPNRDAMFAALLQREEADLRDRGMADALNAGSFEDLIRRTTRVYLEQCRDRGALIQTLLADPSVAQLMEASNREARDRTIRYFVRAARREYGLPLQVAIPAVDALMAATGGAGRQVAEGRLDIEAAAEMVVHLVTGGLRALAGR